VPGLWLGGPLQIKLLLDLCSGTRRELTLELSLRRGTMPHNITTYKSYARRKQVNASQHSSNFEAKFALYTESQ
jgi:hypothetical protein